MDRLIYTALSGMRASMDRQRVVASNMANANTLGFRAELLDQRPVTLKGMPDEARAMQTAAATRSLADIHLGRAAFCDEVSDTVAKQAERLGLELVSASLVSVDQSDLSQRDENNAFNARGMRRLAELVAEERKARIAVETTTETALREHRLAQHQRQIELQRAEREAEIAQQEHLARLEAEAESRLTSTASGPSQAVRPFSSL